MSMPIAVSVFVGVKLTTRLVVMAPFLLVTMIELVIGLEPPMAI